MIADWHTYAIEDFIPFTADTYVRLIEFLNEDIWPLHLVTFLIGVAILALFGKQHHRWPGALLGVVWIWVGYAFHMERYSSLVWAGDYFGWAFIAQGVFLILCGACGILRISRYDWPEWLGAALAVFALTVYPLLIVLSGRGWSGSEWFGIAPDPTAVYTLGVILLAARGAWLVLLLPIPLLWCAVSGATLWALEMPPALLLPVIAAIGLAVALAKAIRKTGNRG